MMKFPLLSKSDDVIDFKRLVLYCLYYAVIGNALSTLYSINDTEFEMERYSTVFFIFRWSFFLCLIVTIFAIPISSFIAYRINESWEFNNKIVLIISSTINSIIYMTVYYFVWSSGCKFGRLFKTRH